MVMILKTIKNEDGFWSVISILLLAVLAVMGLASHVLTRSEGKSVVNKVYALQADYAANGGAYYGIERLQEGPLNEAQMLSIGGATITLDTTMVGTLIQLTVTATKEQIGRSIQIELTDSVCDVVSWTYIQ